MSSSQQPPTFEERCFDWFAGAVILAFMGVTIASLWP